MVARKKTGLRCIPVTDRLRFITADLTAIVKCRRAAPHLLLASLQAAGTIALQDRAATARAGRRRQLPRGLPQPIHRASPTRRFEPRMNKRNPLLPGPLGSGFWLPTLFCLLLLPAFAARADTNSVPTGDLTQLSLQQLMQIEVPTVFSASKFEQKATEAPSSVTVITSDETKRYGWRTLGDLLESVQGFYVTHDRSHEYLGVRGVNLGDFNSRV